MGEDRTKQQLQKLEDVLARFQRTIRTYFFAHTFDLTGSQIFVLRYLSSCPQAKASDIARVSGLSPGAVTQVCDELVRMGYVERLRSNDDRRVVNIVITPKGREKFEIIRKLRSDRMRSILEQLHPDDVDEFLRIVNRIVDIVESESDGRR